MKTEQPEVTENNKQTPDIVFPLRDSSFEIKTEAKIPLNVNEQIQPNCIANNSYFEPIGVESYGLSNSF